MRKLLYILAITSFFYSCDLDGYGPKVTSGGVEVFYTPDSLKESAQSLAHTLDTLGYGEENTVSFKLVKDSIVNINMVTQDQYHTDESLDYALNAISIIAVHQIFNGERVQMVICDNKFNEQRRLEVYE